MFKLFLSKTPRVSTLRIGDHKAQIDWTDSKLLGLDAPYVCVNKRVCGVIRIDLDRMVSPAEIANACEVAGIHPPNLVVGYEEPSGRLRNPHLLWLLANSVPLESKAKRFKGLFNGVSRGLTKALLPLGADPGGLSNPHRVKNPLSFLWSCHCIGANPYSLALLAKNLDTQVSIASLRESHAKISKPAEPARDHPWPEIATQSNRLFSSLTQWARDAIRDPERPEETAADFGERVLAKALMLCAELGHEGRSAESRARSLAARVANWTWEHCNLRRASLQKSPSEIKVCLAKGGRAAAAARSQKSERLIRSAAIELASQLGKMPTQAAVLEKVKPLGVRGEKTVRRHWTAAIEAVAQSGCLSSTTGQTLPPYVKKPSLSVAGPDSVSLKTPSQPAGTRLQRSRVLHGTPVLVAASERQHAAGAAVSQTGPRASGPKSPRR